MATRVNVGLRIPSVHPSDPQQISAFVQHAEKLGFHSIWAGDHVFYHMDVLQPLQLLTWVAGQTSRVRIGTSVMLSSYLNPVLLAKAAATIDTLSGGRLTLGMSLGGTEAEYAGIGVPISQRLGRLLENVAIMRKLWAEEDGVSYQGKYYDIENGNIRPKPVQTRPGSDKPAVPIFLGAAGEAMMKRTARLADGWNASSTPNVQQFLASCQRIRAWAAEAGRDPDSLGFVKQHNISIDADPAVAEQRALAHFQAYYGQRFNVASTCRGTLEQAMEHLAGFQDSDVPEVTLALEPATLDLGHLEKVWEAAKVLR